ncbi:MAG: calcium/sodium antiporter [Candidatus Competibacteraceae bacterium]|nr:calcium/sodium antiporter [Candidatus Competibacteraceae bacterium]
MILAIIFLIVGIVLTIYGANWLVDGASSLAKKLQISNLVIGLTVVSFGTSMPEFVVSLISAIDGRTDIAVGNVIGSNIFNILLILGLTATVYPIAVQRTTIWKEIPFTLLAAVVLLVMANDIIIDGSSTGLISRIDGMVMVSFLIIFLYYSFETSKHTQSSESLVVRMYPIWKSVLLITVGIIGLVGGGKLMVDGAVSIAESLGISEAIIGITIVSVGTSVPELATSLVAASKKNSDIAIGNVVGSNIFNIFFILGVSATISPLPFNADLNIDLLVCTFASVILFAFMFVGNKGKINRIEGIVMFLLYVLYIVYQIWKTAG